ncbi:free fatty acid receptor 2-like [Salarias fasciatus]|uniref:free fatty acid receptor 2-like n=1 Tax=Salarias fasciatus TaxID=181472 RepID=UPI001176F584|nr:free fatty acid receptor 2-like [Salarias fasciatus]
MEPIVKSEIILAVSIVSFLIGFPANLLALFAFSSKIHSKPHPTDILLLNLAVSDLLFLIILPLKMHEAASGMEWTLPNFMCSITAFVFFSSIHTSTLLLTAVSVVRYVAVVHPVSYHRLQKPMSTVVVGIVIWLTSAAHCSIVFIAQHHPSRNNSHVCYKDFTEEQLRILLPVRFEAFFLLSLIPLVICFYCYTRCIVVLCSRPRISSQKKQRAIGMALGTLAVFLICVLPFSLSHLWGYAQGESPSWRDYALLLCTLNTCIDPIISYCSSSAFRCTSRGFVLKRAAQVVPDQQRPCTTSGDE